MKKTQRIRDPIHNLIGFSDSSPEDELLWALLQTPPIQRLRRIRQLGFSEFVYPGATHSRFSHTLGAMQMARRMLGVFRRNKLDSLMNDDYDVNRIATVAAALLHDVGHGPYSHVFEEISELCGIERAHEEYTLEIIQNTEISDILKKADQFERVIELFEREKGYSPFHAIISSQMDCDRLDFLSRDRYFCGVRSSYIDLEWLFDSLTIEEVIVDPGASISEFSFVVAPKGVRVVEEFVISYIKMYQDIYFHKTTRSIQHVVTEALNNAIVVYNGDEVLMKQPAFSYFTDKNKQNLEEYITLDDSSIISLLNCLSRGKYGRATELAERFFQRKPFKCLEIPPGVDGEIRGQLLKKLKEKLEQSNIFYKLDILKPKSYKQYDVYDKKYMENILVKQGDEHVRLHKISNIVRQFSENTVRMYFNCNEDRDTAKNIIGPL